MSDVNVTVNYDPEAHPDVDVSVTTDPGENISVSLNEPTAAPVIVSAAETDVVASVSLSEPNASLVDVNVVGPYGPAYGITSAAEIRALGFFDLTNDGPNSQLDADTLDGFHATAFTDSIQSVVNDAASAQADATAAQADADAAQVDATLALNKLATHVRDGSFFGHELVSNTGQDFVVYAGESKGYAPTDPYGAEERVVLVSDTGIKIASSPDNWSSGWAGRAEMIIDPADNDGTIYFPDPAYSISLKDTKFEFNFSGRDEYYKLGPNALEAEASLYLYSQHQVRFHDLANVHYGYLYHDGDKVRYQASDGLHHYFSGPIRVDTGWIASWNEPLYMKPAGGDTAGYFTNEGTNSQDSRFFLFNPASPAYGSGSGLNNAMIIRTRGDTSTAIGGSASMAIWTQYSTDRHAVLAVDYAQGDALLLRNWENTAWIPIKASAFTVSSSAKNKTNVRTGRDVGGLLENYAVPRNRNEAYKNLRKIRPVIFDDLVPEKLVRWLGCPDHSTRTECAEATCVNEGNVEEYNHVCDEHVCGGTNETPCDLISRHVNRVGFIAEEIAEVYPRAVTADMFGGELGINYDVLVVELWNTIAHLLDDLIEFRSNARNKLDLAENAIRNLNQRVTALGG